MKRHPRFGVAAGLAAALLLTACGGDDDATAADDNGDADNSAAVEEDLALISDGTLSVCSDVPYAPFEFEDADAPSGFSGFDIDLMQAIADNLGLELEVQITGFDAIESGAALTADQCDVAASAMTISEARAENLGFTEPYHEVDQSLLVSTDSGAASLDDFADLTLGVQGATTGEAYAEENAPTEPVAYDDDGLLWQAIQGGVIDGILQDEPVNAVHADEDGYEIVEVFETDEEYGFAVKVEGKEALLAALNDQLGEMRADGTYDEIFGTYFAES